MKKHFTVYLDDGKDVFKAHIPAENEKKAREYVQGNGDVIAVKRGERTASDPISRQCIADALVKAQFGGMEIDLILRALSDCEFID